MADTTKLAEELEQDMRRGVGFDGERTVIVDKRIALRVLAALRAPAAEPVAWMHTQGNYTEASDRPLDADEVSRGWTQVPLYAAINGPAACSAEPHELDPTGMAMWDEVERHVQAGGTLPMTDKPRAQAWCAHGVRADLKCEQCAAQEGVGSAGSGATLPSFKEYWATKKAQGFQYGSDALEQVRMGYEDAARYAQGMADELARVRTELTDYKTGKAEAWTIIDRLTAELAKAREAREFLVAKRKTGESDDD